MFDIHGFERWKRDIYSKYCIRKSREYGLDHYCKGLINLIEERQPKSAFELAIGGGYPFAEKLLAVDIDVAGCDISPELIVQLRKSFPAINACVGGYEELDKVNAAINQKFDLVYCLRSTWYFTDISAAIDFMLYFVRPGGRVIFDIMNIDSEWNKAMVAKKNRFFLLTMGKNVIKFVANLITPGRYMIDILFGVRDIMYSPSEIEAILEDRGLAYETLSLEQIEARGGGGGSFSPDQKLVYVVYKS
jgi:SAM-dependent methyltransferase